MKRLTKSVGFVPWGPWKQHLMTVHARVVVAKSSNSVCFNFAFSTCTLRYYLHSLNCVNCKWIQLVLLGCFLLQSFRDVYENSLCMSQLLTTDCCNKTYKDIADVIRYEGWMESTPSPTHTYDAARCRAWNHEFVHYQFSYSTKSWSTLTDKFLLQI